MFTIYRDTAGEYRWQFVAENGAIMADSAEGYTERNDCREALEKIIAAVRDEGIRIRYLDTA